MLLKENSNAHLGEEEYADLRGKVSEWDSFRGSRPIVFMAESPGPKASRANGNALYLGSDTRRNLDEALGDYAFLLEGAYRFDAAVAKVEGRANDRFYATDGIERVRIVYSYIERTIPHRQITAVLWGSRALTLSAELWVFLGHEEFHIFENCESPRSHSTKYRIFHRPIQEGESLQRS